MYFDLNKIEIIKENLKNDSNLLISKREAFENQTKRLAVNTQTEQVIAEMRITLSKMDEQIHSIKLLIAALNRITEEYMSGEKAIVEHIENGEGIKKKTIVPFQRYSGAEIYGKLLK